MRIAIIGSGAAAMGVLIALRQRKSLAPKITMFDIGIPVSDTSVANVSSHSSVQVEGLGELYSALRGKFGYVFPPPKTMFGAVPKKQMFSNKQYVWRSEHFGGLTNFWGGGMFPFTERELTHWPITAKDLEPWYEKVADNVGISGKQDGLNAYFGDGFVNRPSVRVVPAIERLEALIAGFSDSSSQYDLISGTSRLALETREEHEHACQYLGRCMTGCPSNSVFSASQYINNQLSSGFVEKYIEGRVSRVDRRTITVKSQTGIKKYGKFDLVFLAAGCIGTTEIVMRSLGLSKGPVMRDSQVISFPILGLDGDSGANAGHFPLSNLTIGCLDKQDRSQFIQGSVYPFQDHFWKYFLPARCWPIVGAVANQMRWRILFARFVLPTDFDRLYAFEMAGERLTMVPLQVKDTSEVISKLWSDMKLLMNWKNGRVLPLRPICQGTSSHYSSTLPYGGKVLDVGIQGKIEEGTYVMDSSVFVDSPSISPTFTIMANAARMADLALSS
jgi:hypothetical protein